MTRQATRTWTRFAQHANAMSSTASPIGPDRKEATTSEHLSHLPRGPRSMRCERREDERMGCTRIYRGKAVLGKPEQAVHRPGATTAATLFSDTHLRAQQRRHRAPYLALVLRDVSMIKCLLCPSPAVADSLCVPCGAKWRIARLRADDATPDTFRRFAGGTIELMHAAHDISTRAAGLAFLARLAASRSSREHETCEEGRS